MGSTSMSVRVIMYPNPTENAGPAKSQAVLYKRPTEGSHHFSMDKWLCQNTRASQAALQGVEPPAWTQHLVTPPANSTLSRVIAAINGAEEDPAGRTGLTEGPPAKSAISTKEQATAAGRRLSALLGAAAVTAVHLAASTLAGVGDSLARLPGGKALSQQSIACRALRRRLEELSAWPLVLFQGSG
eukprot:jgi/Mesen1/6684/ME000343S05856